MINLQGDGNKSRKLQGWIAIEIVFTMLCVGAMIIVAVKSDFKTTYVALKEILNIFKDGQIVLIPIFMGIFTIEKGILTAARASDNKLEAKKIDAEVQKTNAAAHPHVG